MKQVSMFAAFGAGLLLLFALNAANSPATAGDASLSAEAEGAVCDVASCEPCPMPCPTPCLDDGAQVAMACPTQ